MWGFYQAFAGECRRFRGGSLVLTSETLKIRQGILNEFIRKQFAWVIMNVLSLAPVYIVKAPGTTTSPHERPQ